MNLENRAHKLAEKSLFISCIVPVFNEEEGISQFIFELQNYLKNVTNCYEIILIDDGSRDETVQKILNFTNDYHVKLLALSRNFGKEIALTAGLEHAKGDVAIILDADFQHPIETISTFLKEWSQGYDMVFGVRNDRDSETYFKRQFATFFYWIMKLITKIEIPNNAGDFRLIDKKIIQALKQFPERSRFMKGMYAWVGYKSKGVPFAVQERVAGKSSWRFSKLTELAITGITSFSDIPLRVWGFIGFIISFISLLYAIYIVTITLLFGADRPGFPTLIVAIMFLGGIQLLSIGIMGEYIGRIFTEVKQRPKYLLDLKIGFDEDDV